MTVATIAVRGRPILFTGPSVRAILDGTKTQTRRVVKLRRPDDEPMPDHGVKRSLRHITEWWVAQSGHYWCHYGQVGDRLWVRETWAKTFQRPGSSDVPYLYRADLKGPEENYLGLDRWGASIHMPRRASRITLELTGVRVERVQDISEDDAIAEGMGEAVGPATSRDFYRLTWNELNVKRGYGWDVNPWVWVLSFTRVQP